LLHVSSVGCFKPGADWALEIFPEIHHRSALEIAIEGMAAKLLDLLGTSEKITPTANTKTTMPMTI
jgi:hypothetical protein